MTTADYAPAFQIYEATVPTDALQPNGVYEVIGSGGAGVPSFAGSLGAPGDLVLIGTTDGSLAHISRSNGVGLSWMSVGGGESVVVTFTSSSVGMNTYQCTFPDSGSAAVPATFLNTLPVGGYTLSIEKDSVGAFTVPDLGLTLTIVSYRHLLSVDLQ